MQNLKMGIFSPPCKQTTPSFNTSAYLPLHHHRSKRISKGSNLMSAQLNLKYKVSG